MPATATYETSGHYYPLTKMNFLVTLPAAQGVAAFTEVTGIDSNVDVIEFRQGNAASLAPVKIPGLVKHGYITLKYGFTKDSSFRAWVADCVNERRGAINRQDMIIELIDIIPGAPQTVPTASAGTDMIWTFKNAWVSKYTGPDLNSMTSEVAMESVEIAYEEIVIANVSAGGAGAGA